MIEKIIELLAGIPDFENGYSFQNMDIVVDGLNDPLDGNLVQFDRIYSCDPTKFLSIQQQNKYNNESEYDPFFIIGQTTSDAFIAFNNKGNVVILDFDETYPGSEDNLLPVYQTDLNIDNFKEIITGFLKEKDTKNIADVRKKHVVFYMKNLKIIITKSKREYHVFFIKNGIIVKQNRSF